MQDKENQHLLIGSLISKKICGTITKDELSDLEEWIDQSDDNRDIYLSCIDTEQQRIAKRKMDSYDSYQAFKKIKSTFNPSIVRRKNLFQAFYPFAAAAIVLVILTLGIYNFYHKPDEIALVNDQKSKKDYQPAENKAFIELSDGRLFELSDSKDIVKFDQKGISYTDGKKIADTKDVSFATIKTPRGGTYQVVLPDGTLATLNAASSITYPTTFSGSTREVKVNGEIYFEVASNKKQPFIVTSHQQKIEVVGTHFNIETYPDERWAKTTLVEGKVKISPISNPQETELLSPGQQAISSDKNFKIIPVDIHTELAWLKGKFDFDGKKLRQVMREISRWYDIDVIYTNEVPDIEFFGGTYRNSNLSTILSILKSSDISYRIEENRKLIISSTLIHQKGGSTGK